MLTIKPNVYGLAFLDAQGGMVSVEGNPASAQPTLPTAQAFATEHQFDAHFTGYGILHPDYCTAGDPSVVGVQVQPFTALSPELPRLTKGILAFFDKSDQAQRATIPAGADVFARLTPHHVVGTIIAIDVDNPQHAKWNDVSLLNSAPLFEAAGRKDPLLAKPSLWYTTSGGCRYVWFLSHPIPVEGPGGLEDIMRGMVAAACLAGVGADTNCKDWTRLFRFPRVRRADKPNAEARTQEQPYFRMSWGCVDASLRQMDVPAEVIAYPASAFRPLSQMAEAEFTVNDVSLGFLHVFRGRIGRDPGESRSGMANIRIGDVNTNENEVKAELYQVLPNGTITTKPTANAVRAKHIIEGLANPKSKDRKPLAAAQSAVERLYQGRLLFANEVDGSGWHDGAYALAANVCYCLRNELGEHEGAMTPQFIFALLFDPARNANNKRQVDGRPDARSEDTVRRELWSIVASNYRRYRFQRDITQQEKDEEERSQVADTEAQSMAQSLAENLIKAQLMNMVIDSIPGEREREEARARSPDPSARNSWASAWVNANWRKYLILSCPKQGRAVLSVLPGNHVAYSKLGESDEGLYTMIRECGHNLISDLKPAKDPGDMPSLIPVPQIMRECGSQCTMAYSRTIPYPTMRVVKAPDGAQVTYVARAEGMRTDIEPVFHPGVDTWLHAMAGESFEKVKDWLACFVRIDEPIAGLYLEGAPGVGKGMLSEALQNLTEAKMAAPFSQVIDQFQDTMIRTPFILGDEEGSSANGSTRSPMNLYKKIITGEFNTCNPKGKPPVRIEGYWRLLFTANNDKLLEWKGDVNEMDMGAMIVRTLHVMCDEATAKTFLDSIGGKAGTKGWPEKEIPQHIMWLTQNHKVIPGTRLLVEGVRSGYHDNMAVNTGGTHLLLEAVQQLLSQDTANTQEAVLQCKKHHITHEWSISVELTALRSYMLKMFKDDNTLKVPQRNRLKESIKTMSLKKEPVSTHWQIGSRKRVYVRVWPIDLRYLLKSLRNGNYPFDLRPGMPKECWEALAPADIRAEVENGSEPHHAPPALRPPPPPPIQFPAASAFGNSGLLPPPPRPAPPWPTKTKD